MSEYKQLSCNTGMARASLPARRRFVLIINAEVVSGRSNSIGTGLKICAKRQIQSDRIGKPLL